MVKKTATKLVFQRYLYNNSEDITYKNSVGILHIFQTQEMWLEKDRKKEQKENCNNI